MTISTIRRRPAPLIGLMGAAGAGKDTAALMVPGAAYVAFADTLREALLATDPIIPDGEATARLSEVVARDGWDGAKRENPEVRRLLQAMGTAMREVRPRVWVDAAIHRVLAVPESVPVVVTDVRMPDEADMIRHLGGVLVRVERPGAGLAGAAGRHESETAAEAITPDAVLCNGGDLAGLRVVVAGLVRWARDRGAAVDPVRFGG